MEEFARYPHRFSHLLALQFVVSALSLRISYAVVVGVEALRDTLHHSCSSMHTPCNVQSRLFKENDVIGRSYFVMETKGREQWDASPFGAYPKDKIVLSLHKLKHVHASSNSGAYETPSAGSVGRPTPIRYSDKGSEAHVPILTEQNIYYRIEVAQVVKFMVNDPFYLSFEPHE
ncbi:hypothetical protein VNO77_37788 [Canavalia gladiata]|uniref:Uncharacterized protein n=1 Tax=Canavalia gladiata TaxID=3824 RepID=A0AAN9KBE7_CANGL